MSVNHVIEIGNLTRDSETRFTSGGMAICKFSIAVNERRKQGDEWIDEANFFDVSLFGKSAENLGKYLVKGKQVAVEGKLKQNRWEHEGKAMSKVEIVANNVQLLGGKQEGHADEPPPSRAPSGSSEPPEFVDDIPGGPIPF